MYRHFNEKMEYERDIMWYNQQYDVSVYLQMGTNPMRTLLYLIRLSQWMGYFSDNMMINHWIIYILIGHPMFGLDYNHKHENISYPNF